MTGGSFRSSLARRQLGVFFALTFLLSWLPWLLSIARGNLSGGGINSLGPIMAALLVAGIADGRAGLADLGRRLTRWKVPAWCYLVVLGLPVVLMTLASILTVATGAPRPTDVQLAAWRGALASAPLILLFDGPFGEELGWRGFALPRMLVRLRPIAAALGLGLVWAGWHLPLFVSRPGLWIVPMVLWIVFASVILTWLHQRTGGSALLATLFHASVNVIGGGYLSRMFTGADSTRQYWFAAGLYGLVALALAPGLSRGTSPAAGWSGGAVAEPGSA